MLYQRWPDHHRRRASVQAAAENDRLINGACPIYAYVSPYKAGLVGNGGFLGDAEQLGELSDARRTVNGAIVWTQSAPADRLETNQNWAAGSVGWEGSDVAGGMEQRGKHSRRHR
jgi:hypothetical protein